MGYASSLLLLVVPAASAAPVNCSSTELTSVAARVRALRAQLQAASVPVDDPVVPPAVVTKLSAFKQALNQAAQAAFTCAPEPFDPEATQKTLASALEANQTAEIAAPESRKGRDQGTYGADLTVQLLPLSTRPWRVEVDFRFGVECGEDHLLLLFEKDADLPHAAWNERLQWGSAPYTNVREALGDFAMLTPLTGSFRAVNWRYVAVHGQPACHPQPGGSTFALDLLSPTADPARPHVDWHFDHSYTAGSVLPQLQTTDDSIDFRLKPAKAAGAPTADAVYRFHLGAKGEVQPGPSTTPTPVRSQTSATGAPPVPR